MANSKTNFFDNLFGNNRPQYTLKQSVEGVGILCQQSAVSLELNDLVYGIRTATAFAQDKAICIDEDLAGQSNLQENEISALALITSCLHSENASLLSLVNDALCSSSLRDLKPYSKFIWLLLWSMKQCPCSSKEVYRVALEYDCRLEYKLNDELTWKEFAFCSSLLNIADSGSMKTIFALELSSNRARVITNYSFFPNDHDVLLAPNCRFVVTGIEELEAGVVVMQLREIECLDPILVLEEPDPLSPPPPPPSEEVSKVCTVNLALILPSIAPVSP